MKRIAIVGGGFLGSELACALGRRGRDSALQVVQVSTFNSLFTLVPCSCSVDVFQLFPESGNMAKVLPEYLSKWTMQKVQAEGVTVIPNSKLQAVNFVDGQVQLTLDNGEKVRA